jgi:hypothetical protein
VSGERRAALEEWIRLAHDFLGGLKSGQDIPAEALGRLLERRARLLDALEGGGALSADEAGLAHRLQVLEEELARRVDQDLARRRRDLDELDRTRRLLRGYAEGEAPRARPSRFIDTKS